MKILACMLLLVLRGYSQGSPPWEHPLKMAWSADGTHFGAVETFQDSAGVPSMIRWKGDTLACVFQWFRKPVNSLTWDRVAVKFSYDAGATWTGPQPIIVSGLPPNYQRPFDPALAVVSSGALRIYFSSSDGMPSAGQEAVINTYSAVGSDGVHYTFEPNPRFDHPTTRVIDPAVIYFNDTWHYLAPAGAPQDGAFHATGNNGLDFVQQGNIASDNTHNWTGNFMVNAQGELRFYGSGEHVWFNSSADGTAWQGYVNTTIAGGDPTVVRMSATKYLAIYTADRYITGLEQPTSQTISVSPNPFHDQFKVSGIEGKFQYWLSDVMGRVVVSGSQSEDESITVDEISSGLYVLKIQTALSTQKSKLIRR